MSAVCNTWNSWCSIKLLLRSHSLWTRVLCSCGDIPAPSASLSVAGDFNALTLSLFVCYMSSLSALQLAAELSNLQQQQRVSQLELKTLQAGIQSRQQLIKKHTRQLAALEG